MHRKFFHLLCVLALVCATSNSKAAIWSSSAPGEVAVDIDSIALRTDADTRPALATACVQVKVGAGES